jgi:hypothetical protein
VENLQIVAPFIASADNYADFFTTALCPKAFLRDTWAWQDLRVSLGTLDNAEVCVCVGLNSGGSGGKAVFVDRLQLGSHLNGSSGGAPPCQSPPCQPSCKPSPLLVGVSSLFALAAPGSCGFSVNLGGLIAIAVVGGLIALGYSGRGLSCLWKRRQARREPRERRFKGLEVTASPACPSPCAS